MAAADKAKFKVGDRVRFNTKKPLNSAAYTDDVLTVIADYGDDSFEVRYPSRLEQTVEACDLEHVAVAQQPQQSAKQPLRIQPGKFYITRDGRKVGPMRRWHNLCDHPWEAEGGEPYVWSGTGREIDSNIDDSADLVAEADEPPAEPQTNKEILDELEAWIAEQDAIKAAGKGSTAGYTVPLCAYEDDFDICGYREPVGSDGDDDVVQLSVGELTAALADSLKVARKVGKTIKCGDLVVLARPALVTGINADMRTVSIQTDGGNYSLPLVALTAA